MARLPSLNESEVSLIKTMLARGWSHSLIQLFFNNPQRFVNNGRISEIKSGTRWSNVIAATEFELDEFVDLHPLRSQMEQFGKLASPVQNQAASRFTVSNRGIVDAKDDSPAANLLRDPQFTELYDELKHKLVELKDIGHNGLGEINVQVNRLAEALPENPQHASITLVYLRGISLRNSLAAHQSVSRINEPHPAKLDQLCAARLTDVVQAFNILVVSDPKAALLDRQSLGPLPRATYDAALAKLSPVLEGAVDVSTESARLMLSEQVADSLSAPKNSNGEKVVAIGTGSATNFFTAIVTFCAFQLRKAVGFGISELLKKAKSAAYVLFLGEFAAVFPHIVAFLNTHAPTILHFLEEIKANEIVQELLKIFVNFQG